MENRSQKHFVLFFILGLLILVPQLLALVWPQAPAPIPSSNQVKLVQVAHQHPFLFFQPIPINSADAQQFSVVPGIGPALSSRIVSFRLEHGPFRSLDELGLVNGIGPQKLAMLKEYCRL